MSDNAIVSTIGIARKNILSELFGLLLLQKCGVVSRVIQTDPINAFTPEMFERVKNKHVLIAGGYYCDNDEELNRIINAAGQVIVFYNHSDTKSKLDHTALFPSDDGRYGFASWCLGMAAVLGGNKDLVSQKIARLLDADTFGHTSTEILEFKYGLYTRSGEDSYVKLSSVVTESDFEETCAAGRRELVKHESLVQSIVESSRIVKIELNDKSYQICVAKAGAPIVQSTLALAKRSPDGIGLSMRYEEGKSLTRMTLICTEESGVNAGLLIKQLMGGAGGGSFGTAGGCLNGEIVDPENFFTRFESKKSSDASDYSGQRPLDEISEAPSESILARTGQASDQFEKPP